METRSPYTFTEGLRDGIPIAVGYLSVSFGFGITAIGEGLRVLEAALTSVLNLTSAGQVAGVRVIGAGGTLLAVILSLILTEFVINIRYSLMGVTLTQRLDSRCTTGRRLVMSFGLTDEIFAVAVSKEHPVGPSYFYGLMTLPYAGWIVGTLGGALAGQILPEDLRLALGIAVYAMFIAIVLPPMKKSCGISVTVAAAVLLNCCFRYIPGLQIIPETIAVIISAVAAAVVMSFFFPIPEEAEEEKEGSDHAC